MSKLTEDSRIDQIAAQWLDATPETEGAEAIPGRWVVNVRRADRVLRDGAPVTTTYHRHVVEPGHDLKDEDPAVQAVAKALWRA